jgi:glycogen debranching enzyme
MTDLINIEGQHYIRSTSSMADNRTLVLKHDETFAVFDRHGDLQPVGLGEQGIFHMGTRFLSRLALTVNGQRPLLLSSTVRRNNSQIAVDLTNPDLKGGAGTTVPQDTLHILRSCFLWHGVCYQRLAVSNFGAGTARVQLGLEIGADFVDIFEVRGEERPARGELQDPIVTDSSTTLSYIGLDNIERVTRVTSVSPATEVTGSSITFDAVLAPHQVQVFDISIACGTPALPKRLPYEEADDLAVCEIANQSTNCASIFTSNEQFNDWINQSLDDLRMLLTVTDSGTYPYAGTPWYSTAFGRDGIITAIQLLWADASIAAGVLRYLATTQAVGEDTVSDAEPGKILHETRNGEMAALGEIPFGMYYGSVDATPLFVVLAGQYYEVTGDRELVESIWSNIEAALAWVETYGDIDGDGFVEYQRKTDAGLLNQGWKDSFDSIFHADGTQAEPPIAICEMQGYVYAARMAASNLAEILGHHSRASVLHEQAESLRQKFEQQFWDEELGTYVLALDGDKRPCRVASSNAGHVLFSGIASYERAGRVAETLLSQDSYSGWGVRTIAVGEERYNPMSYHNGSVWPHDNAMIAAGLARYGLQEQAARIMTGLFDASIFMENHRLPELFCGFPRRAGEGPTLYPIACLPQAWAAGSVFMLLQACLGMAMNGKAERLFFTHSWLPEYLTSVRISNLKVGSSTLDLSLQRGPNDVSVNVLGNDGSAKVVVTK